MLERIVFHSREEWQDPAQPITGPATRQPMQHGIAHWTGTNRTAAPTDVGAFLRNLQAVYLRDRNYSLGYNMATVAEGTTGHVWEIRGHDINNAANAGRKVAGNANDWTKSVLLLGDERIAAPPELCEVTAHAFWMLHDAAATAPAPVQPHQAVDYTACCGDLWSSQAIAGMFDPQQFNPPEEDDMTPWRYIIQPPTDRAGGPWFVREGASTTYANSQDVAVADVAQVERYRPIATQYDIHCIEVFGTADLEEVKRLIAQA